MNSNAISTISAPFNYKSDINVKFNCKGNPFQLNFKNRGTKALFNVVCKALCGYDVTDGVPAVLDFVDAEGSLLRHKVYFSNGVYGEAADNSDAEQGVLSLSAVLTYDDKIYKSPNYELVSPELQLKGKDDTVLCVIGGTDYAEQLNSLWSLLTETTNAIIEWKLIFDNGGN